MPFLTRKSPTNRPLTLLWFRTFDAHIQSGQKDIPFGQGVFVGSSFQCQFCDHDDLESGLQDGSSGMYFVGPMWHQFIGRAALCVVEELVQRHPVANRKRPGHRLGTVVHLQRLSIDIAAQCQFNRHNRTSVYRLIGLSLFKRVHECIQSFGSCCVLYRRFVGGLPW